MLSLGSTNSGSCSSNSGARFELPELHVIETNGSQQTVRLAPEKPVVNIGRSRHNEVALHDGLVSGRHVRLELRPDGVYIEDLGSRHGTRVNGQLVPQDQPCLLHDSDEIQIGKTTLRYRCYAERIDALCAPGALPRSVAESRPPSRGDSEAEPSPPPAGPGEPADATLPPRAMDLPKPPAPPPGRWLWQLGVLLLVIGVGVFLWFMFDVAELARGVLG